MGPGGWSGLRALVRAGLGLATGPDEARLELGGDAPPGLEGLAARQGLAGFLLFALERTGAAERLPPARRRSLAGLADRERGHLIRINLLAAETLRLLAGWGIPAVVVKGIAIDRFWPEPLLRTMQDLDVVVPWEHREELWRRYGALWRLQESLGVLCEVEPAHHDLTAGATVPFSFQGLFDRAERVVVAGEEALAAGPQDLLLGAAISCLRKDARFLRLILDAAFLVRSGRLDPAVAGAEARRLGLAPPLHLLLRQGSLLFGLPLDPEWSRVLATRRDRLAGAFLGLRAGGPPPARWFRAGAPSRWLLRFLLEPPGRLLRQGLLNLFPPPLALRNQYFLKQHGELPLPRLYLRHWLSYLRRLGGR